MQCPNCQQDVSETDPTCQHCGHDLVAVAPPQSTATPRRFPFWVALVLAALIVGIVGGALLWEFYVSTYAPTGLSFAADEAEVESSTPAGVEVERETGGQQASGAPTSVSLLDQIQPPGGYALAASFGDIGPQLLAVGAIDYDRFAQVYRQAGQPLTEAQVAILKESSDAPVVIDRENSYFLLNFFWALGLANQNPVLDKGPMMKYGEENVGRFASTGGWTIGQKPATEFYSSAAIIPLTAEQQARLEEAAGAVYRPCCNNPTSFPDCNHGMAMLGLLELMAAEGATVDEMFEAAKYVNAFWFPQQTLELATYFEATEGVSFADLDARTATGRDYFSVSGYRAMYQWLADNDLLKQIPNQGGSCGV